MLLQAALNGPFGKAHHPALPVLADELAADAAACAAAGAGAIHLHPRDGDGAERLDAVVVDPVVRAVRDACGMPVGVSTGAWIAAGAERRAALVSAWTAPDYASLNVAEDGWELTGEALLGAGVGIEAGVWTVDDARALARSSLAPRVQRVLVEPVEVPAASAIEVVAAIHAELDAGGVTAPRLQHGDGGATWVIVEDAIRRGCDTRVGLEDTTLLPDGTPAAGNAELVAAAAALMPYS